MAHDRREAPRQGEGTTESKPPEPKAAPPIKLDGWREGNRKLLEAADKLIQEADHSKSPAQYVYNLQRAAGLRMQAAFLRRFIIETVQHMEWVRQSLRGCQQATFRGCTVW